MKLAGVVVLYEPSADLINNINTYIDELQILYVIDNSKNSNSNLFSNEKIYYIFNQDNKGIAYALNKALKLAIKNNYEWLLTMDQDSFFINGGMNYMKKIMHKYPNTAIFSPKHIFTEDNNEIISDISYPFDVMTSGNIINTTIIKKIGFFDESLFIDMVDVDVCIRLHKNNYEIIQINNALLKHKLGNLKVHKIGKNEYYCNNHSPLRRYYITRNSFYLANKYYDIYPDYCVMLKRNIKEQIKGIILFEKNKIKKLIYIFKGYNDYKKGKKGKFHEKIIK